MANHSENEKSPIYQKWWFWVIIAIVILIIIGSQNGGTTQPSSSQPQTTSTKTEQKTEYVQGEEAILGNGAITVTQIERSQGTQYDKPSAGKEFVIVHVKIENKGSDNLSYNPYYFKIQNSQGQQENTTFTTVDQDTSLNSGELIPGGIVEGTLTFEEKTGDTGLILIYNDNLWSSQELKIKLNS